MITNDIINAEKRATEAVSAGVEAAATRAEEASRSMREKLRYARQTATERAHAFQDAALDTVTKRPALTIATAVLIGTTLGFFAGRKRREH